MFRLGTTLCRRRLSNSIGENFKPAVKPNLYAPKGAKSAEVLPAQIVLKEDLAAESGAPPLSSLDMLNLKLADELSKSFTPDQSRQLLALMNESIVESFLPANDKMVAKNEVAIASDRHSEQLDSLRDEIEGK
jgi:hypothetical protein